MRYDFDEMIDRRHTGSSKWDRYGERDITPMWIADMDFRSPPEVVEALQRRVEHGIFGYTDPPKELTDRIVAMYRETWGWTIDPSWVAWLPGLDVTLSLVCQAMAEPGDDILVPVPVYPPFLGAVKSARCRAVTVPLVQGGGRWAMDLEAMEQAVTPRTRVLLFCNPHNPVGRLYTADEIAAVVRLCERHDIALCSDEVHCQLILDEGRRHVPAASLSPEAAARTITLMAPSKTYNLPGLRCSFAVVPNAELRRRLRRAKRGLLGGVNLMGYTAALAAFTQGDAWLEALLEYLRANRDLVERTIAELPGLSMAHVEATYLAWIDTRPLGLEDPAKFFEDAGVGLQEGGSFLGQGFVRINFACPRSRLQEALERIRRAVDSR